MITKNSLRIGFIGIGLMGGPMVRRLLAAGYRVTIWNRTVQKCESLEKQGAKVADSIAALVAEVDVIMLCLSDTKAVEDIVFGENAIENSARSGQVLIDFSSIDPGATENYASILKKNRDVDWIDAPVSGGTKGAEDGTLIIMAGGEISVLDRIKPVFRPLSKKVTHMGPNGAGQMTKLCNQMVVACNGLVIAEMIALARRANVEVDKLPEALAGGFADSIPLQILAPQMAEHDFTLKWKVSTLLKDLNSAVAVSKLSTGKTPMSDVALQLLRGHADKGNSDKDFSTVIELYDLSNKDRIVSDEGKVR